MAPIRILLVDDQLLFRKGLRALLEDEADFEVVGEAPDGSKALEFVRSARPDVVLMDLRPEELFELVHGVLRGETPLSPAVAGKLLSEIRQRPWRDPAEAVAWDLTSRELEILQLVAGGFSNAEIAGRLFIVEGTVKNHVHNILEKLHLENRVQAAAHAIREGLVNMPKNPEEQPGRAQG